MYLFVIVLLLGASFLTTGFAVVMVYALNARSRSVAARRRGELVDTKTIDLTHIDTIDLQFYQDDIVLMSSETEEFILKEYKTYTPQEDELATLTIEENRLNVKGKEVNVPFSLTKANKYYTRFEVCIPPGYNAALTISTTSGNIGSEIDLRLARLHVRTSSGDIILRDIVADQMDVSTASGLVSIQKAEGNRKLNSSSGYIKINGGSGDSEVNTASGGITMINTSGMLNVNSASGGILITSLDGGGSINTSSGRIDYTLQEITKPVKVNSSSGDVIVQLPEHAVMNFTASSESGRIQTFFDEYATYNENRDQVSAVMGNNPTLTVQISSGSGDINVKQY